MSIFSKIGNILEDTASFAVPAATSAGLTLLSGGTINPGTQAGLMALLGSAGAGAGGFARNEAGERVRKQGKQQDRNNAMANFVNTLSPTSGYQARQAQAPAPGLGETVAGGASQGIQAFQVAKQMADAKKVRDLQTRMLEQQVEAGDRAAGSFSRSGAPTIGRAQAAQSPIDPDASKTFLESVERNAREGVSNLDTPVPMIKETALGGGRFRQDGTVTRTLGDAARDMGGAENLGPDVQSAIAAGRRTATEEATEQAIDASKLQMDARRLQLDLDKFAQSQQGGDEPDPSDVARMENDLLGKFTGLTKDYRQVRDSYGRVIASSDNPSAAGDLSLIFNYMKMLDPGSVVRESEFATAAATGSYGERLKAAGSRLLEGQRLSDQMRQDFVNRSKQLFQSQQQSFQDVAEEFTAIAKGRGLNPANIIIGGAPPRGMSGSQGTGIPPLDDIEAELRRRNANGGIMSRIGAGPGVMLGPGR